MNKKLAGYLLCSLLALASAQSYARSLDEIKKDELIVGMRKNREAPPMRYTENGMLKGIDIEIITQIAKGFGVPYRVEFLQDINDRIPSLLENRVDIVVDTFVNTKERREKIDFSSMPYLVTGVGLLLSNKYKGIHWEDIGIGKKVEHLNIAIEEGASSIKGTSSNMKTALEKRYPKEIEFTPYLTDKEAFEAFLRHEVDGFTQEKVVLQPRADKGYILEGQLTYDAYGVGVSKAFPDVRDAVSRVLENLENSGMLSKIINRYTSLGNQSPSTSIENPHLMADTVDYTIKTGDTLSGIATAECGNSKWGAIFEINKATIAYPDILTPGKIIRIPNNCKEVAFQPNKKLPVKIQKPTSHPLPINLDDMQRELAYWGSLYKEGSISETVFNEKSRKIMKKYGQ